MSLKNLVRRELTTCQPNTSIQEAARLMKRDNVGAVLVTSAGRPVGIITDRDIVMRCTVEGHDCTVATVQAAMSQAVETVSEQEGLYDVAAKMSAAHVRRIPVVDNEGRAVALLSSDDVFELLAEEMNHLKSAIKPAIPKIVNERSRILAA